VLPLKHKGIRREKLSWVRCWRTLRLYPSMFCRSECGSDLWPCFSAQHRTQPLWSVEFYVISGNSKYLISASIPKCLKPFDCGFMLSCPELLRSAIRMTSSFECNVNSNRLDTISIGYNLLASWIIQESSINLYNPREIFERSLLPLAFITRMCIVLYLYIYIALLTVHTNQKRFQCERPREKRGVGSKA